MDGLRAFLRKLKFMIKKELLATIKDPRTRTILFLPVIMQTMLFGYAATFNLDEVQYACLDQSRSKYSTELIAKIEGSGVFRRVQTLNSTSEIAEAIDSDAAMLVVNIPADFADKLVAGERAEVQVITDGRNSSTSGIAAGYVNSIVADYNARRNGGRILETETIAWYNPNLITRWMFLPALIPMMSLSQVLMLAGLSVAREREQGTFDQLLVTPIEPSIILIGKAIPPILIGLIQATFALIIMCVWFEIKVVGSLFTLYLVLLVFLLSCVGIGLSISAVSANMQQVMVYCFMAMMPLSLLSGVTTPVRNMPQVLQYFTLANPLRFATEAVRRIFLEGSSLATVAYALVPMLLIAGITLPVAGWFFRNKL